MKLVVLSDTHEKHEYIKVPDGDVLIHCGDWTNKGSLEAIRNFLQWFVSHPHQYKLFIAGNHELSLNSVNRPIAMSIINEFINNKVIYLENSEVIIEGLKFYGSPATPYFFNFAFNYHRGRDIEIEWDKIPEDVNILITHGPPYGILDLVNDNILNKGRDLHQGCEDLANRIYSLVDLKAHLFGHLHLNGGNVINVNNIIYGNAAICNDYHQPVNYPLEIQI